MGGERKGLIRDVSWRCERTSLRPWWQRVAELFSQRALSAFLHGTFQCGFRARCAEAARAAAASRVCYSQSSWPWFLGQGSSLILGNTGDRVYGWVLSPVGIVRREAQPGTPQGSAWERTDTSWNSQGVCGVNTASFVPKLAFIIYLLPLLTHGHCSEGLKFWIKRFRQVCFTARWLQFILKHIPSAFRSPFPRHADLIWERKGAGRTDSVLPSLPEMHPVIEREWSETYWVRISGTVVRELWVGREVIFIFCDNFPEEVGGGCGDWWAELGGKWLKSDSRWLLLALDSLHLFSIPLI